MPSLSSWSPPDPLGTEPIGLDDLQVRRDHRDNETDKDSDRQVRR
ncbi:hypothetical protein [Sediminivirga luteola]|nr:hypothetical protein [Sediminivirga luteola]